MISHNKSFFFFRFEQNRQLTTAQPSQISQITENLFLCSAALVNEKLLERLGVTCIITAAPELPNFPLQNKSIIYRKVPVADSNSSNIFQYFDEVADLIHKVKTIFCTFVLNMYITFFLIPPNLCLVFLNLIFILFYILSKKKIMYLFFFLP